MRKMLLLAMCFFGPAQLCGQSAKETFDTFCDSVLNQQLVLRNFDGGTQVHAAWTGTRFELDAPKWHMFGVLQVRSVKKQGQEIRLQCERHVMQWNGLNSLAPYPVADSVEIFVDVRAGNPIQLLPLLRDAIFYSSTSDALAAVPKTLQRFVPAHLNPEKVQTPCDCSESQQCVGGSGAEDSTLPRAVYTADPAYSEEGSKRRINGSVTSAFIVDETGHIQDVWITRPLGYGMDEKAAEAVLTYVFKPATCHGNPVSMAMTSEIQFQIF